LVQAKAAASRQPPAVRRTVEDCQEGMRVKTQFYRDGKLVQIESDRDHDGAVDHRDFFEQEKRVRHERILATGQLEQVIVFDGQERPLTMQRDTSGDGRFDVFTWYENGQPAKEEKDTNFDDTADVFVVFDAKISCRFSPGWQANVGVDNITDELYHVSHPYPMRTYFAELKYAF
jgi:hypothetical protein